MKTAILFAGQGAQVPGMGRELYDNFASVRTLFAEATAVCREAGYTHSMEEICFELPAEELNKTAHSQPAIFTLSMAGLAVLREECPGLAIDAMAGFSLGECSALCGAGVLGFADTLRLILARGAAMGAACEASSGAMAAILGIDASVCEDVCRGIAGGGILMPVNYNCPGQTVIAGEAELVEKAAAALKEAGAMKAVPLAVQGAFHTPLMNPGRDRFTAQIASMPFAAPSVTLYSDVTGAPVSRIDAAYLGVQMTSPVRWQTIIEAMLSDGVECFIEVGPGRVLSGLVRRISRTAKLGNVEDLASLAKVRGMIA